LYRFLADEIRIDASKKFQSILGFGGAFTDVIKKIYE
jgi:hypothetical protein